MECLVGIVSSIVGKITQYTVSPVIRQVDYVISYNKNVKKLQSQVGDLVNARERVQHSVEAEERNNKRVEKDVESWLTSVEEMTEKANAFLSDEQHAEVKCLHGFCPNLKLRHQLSRQSTKLVLDVVELYAKKDFTSFAYEVPPQEISLIATPDYEAFDSRTSTVRAVMDELKKFDTYMIGVYGIGGVGKTTLVKEIYRQVTTGEKLFEEVVMVLDLKQNPSIRRIQKLIAEKLGLELSETDTEDARARNVCNRIKDKKTLVLLDDVWESIDLEAVGLPRMATLKILLTSRTRLVLSSEMGTQKEFPLDVLNEEESWSLFKQKAGDVVKDHDIGAVATQVATKCGGLPLLIVTVARSLKNSSLPDWRDTLRQLKRLDGQGLTEKTYSVIEWGYNRLESKEIKSVFLLCACEVGSQNSIKMLDLLKYSMGLGILSNVQTMDEAYDALHSMIEKSKDSCLLLASHSNEWVTIHDLVKDVAKDIALRDHMVLSISHGSELKEWPDNKFCQKCSMISLKYCSIPQFPEVLQCQELKLFHLSCTIQDVPDNFFREMKKLRVLDLTRLSMPFLPSSLQFLKSLRTLCLDLCTLGDLSLVGELRNLEILSLLYSKFERLPTEIGQLTRLRLLDLTGCTKLEVISPNVLSRLTRLEQLRLGNSFNQWEAGGGIFTERRNANLEELKHLSQLTVLQIHIPDANILPPNLFTNHKLQRYQVCIGSAWKWTDVNENLNTLKLQLTASNELDQGLIMLLKSTKELYLEGIEGINNNILSQVGIEGIQHLKHLHVQNYTDVAYMINGKIGFPNLTWLAISELNDSKFMLSSLMARCLVRLERLQISNCRSMEHIISIEKSDEESIGIMFSKLEDLELKNLPNLLKFYSRNDTNVPTPSIERLEVEVCTESDIICDEIAETESKGNTHFLFDDKVELPNLKSLSIYGLTMLTTIWHSELASDSFCKLKDLDIQDCDNLVNMFVPSIMGKLSALDSLSVERCKSLQLVFELEGVDVRERLQDTSTVTQLKSVSCSNLSSVKLDDCESLENVFPAWLARNLQKLQSLIVTRCGVEQIIAKEEGLQTTPPKFMFPKVTKVHLFDLARLKNLYPEMHASYWPSLNDLRVVKCEKVNIFGMEISSFQEEPEPEHLCNLIQQSLFLIEKDSFPNLEWLVVSAKEFWNGPFPAGLFSKLKHLDMACTTSRSVTFLNRALIVNHEEETIFDTSTSTSGGLGTQQQQQYLHLRELRLIEMKKLMHLGYQDEEDNSQSASSCPNIPNLEILTLLCCHGLRNLRTSLISFKNLSTLTVSYCAEMEYLVTTSPEI